MLAFMLHLDGFFIKSYTCFDVHWRDLSGVIGDPSTTVDFDAVSGLVMFDVDQERGTERNELEEEHPASDEGHATWQVVTVGRRRSQVMSRSFTVIILLLMLLLFIADLIGTIWLLVCTYRHDIDPTRR